MKTVTVSEATKSLGRMVDELEASGEEVLLMRRSRRVARLVPEEAHQNALEVFGDIEGVLRNSTGNNLASSIAEARRRKSGSRLNSLRNPWVS